MNPDHIKYAPDSSVEEPAVHRSEPLDNVETRVLVFQQGDTAAFDSPSLVEVIVQRIFDLYYKGDVNNAVILLENLGDSALNKQKDHRERSLIALSLIAERILRDKIDDLLEIISKLLLRWLGKEEEIVAGFEFICLQLGQLIDRMLNQGLWGQAEIILVALEDIRKSNAGRNQLISRVISKVQTRVAKQQHLEKLVDSYIDSTDMLSDTAGTLLVSLGDKSGPFLIQKLAISQRKEERFKLLDLIPEAGSDIVPSLTNQLQGRPPWYFARNIIHIMSRLEDASLYPYVRPYMNHSDTRVQHEVIQYIQLRNGGDTASRLLDAVNVCSDSLKPKLIGALGPMKEKRIGNTFIGILKNISAFDRKYRDDIIQEICRHLTLYPTERVFQALESLYDSSKAENSLTTETKTLIEKTYHQIKEELSQPSALPENAAETKQRQKRNSKVESPPSADRASRNTPKLPSSAYRKPMRSSSSGSVPLQLKKHIQRRQGLYGRMSHSELLTFTSHLQHKSFHKGEKLAGFGDIHSLLFFIEEGVIELNYSIEPGRPLRRELSAGDIFGHEIFMNGSEWNASLTALRHTEAYLFDQEHLLTLQPNFPELCRAVIDYCKKHEIVCKDQETRKGTIDKSKQKSTIPFTDDIGEPLSDAVITSLHERGCSFSFNLPPGVDHSIFQDKELFVTIKSEATRQLRLKAKTIETHFFEEKGRMLNVVVNYDLPLTSSSYTCTAINL